MSAQPHTTPRHHSAKELKHEPEELIEFTEELPEAEPVAQEDEGADPSESAEADESSADETDHTAESKPKDDEAPNQRILREYAQGILPGDVLRTFECLPVAAGAAKKKRVSKVDGTHTEDSGLVPEKPSVIIGPGIRQVQSQIISSRSGVVRIQQSRKGTKYWIDHSTKRYVPAMEDQVVGVIVERFMDYYKVDIGCNAYAILPNIAFEGATKRNKPNLQVGNLVYARVVLANKDLEPELVCYAPTNRSEGFGELKDGYMFECSQALSRSLMLPDCFVLQELGKRIPFEIACGANGRVWINSQSHKNTIILTNIITDSEFLRPAKIQAMIDMIFQKK